MGIEKMISVQKVFSKSSFPWSMLPEKPRHSSGFHKKVFMKRPNVHYIAIHPLIVIEMGTEENVMQYVGVLAVKDE